MDGVHVLCIGDCISLPLLRVRPSHLPCCCFFLSGSVGVRAGPHTRWARDEARRARRGTHLLDSCQACRGRDAVGTVALHLDKFKFVASGRRPRLQLGPRKTRTEGLLWPRNKPKDFSHGNFRRIESSKDFCGEPWT
jgi:hypothetical protein